MRRWWILLLCATAVLAQDAKQLRELADGLYTRKLYELAIAEYLRISTQHPDYASMDVVLYRLAESYTKLGQAAKADAAYAKLSLSFPQSAYAPRAQLRRAETLVQGGQHDQALLLLANVLKKQPGTDLAAGAHYYSGISHAALKRNKLAATHFLALTTEFATSPYASLAALEHARILQEVPGNETELLRLFQLAADRPASPEIGAEARFQLGNLLFRQKKWAESSREFATLFASHADSKRSEEARLTAAWSAFNRGAVAEALTMLQAMPQARIMKSPAEWLYLKANCLRQQKEYDEAVLAYQRLAKTAPNSEFTPNARYELVLILYEQKRYEEVAKEAALLTGVPDLKENALWLQADANQQLGRKAEAATVYARLAREFPKAERAVEALFSAAQGFQEAGDFKQAAGLFQQYAVANPKHELAPRAWYACGLCHLKAGAVDPAVGAWKTLSEAHPDHELADDGLFQAGISLLKLKRSGDATKALQALLEIKPDSKHAHQARFFLAVLLDEEGKTVEAEAAWNRFLENKPVAPFLEQGQHRLGINLYRQKKYDAAAAQLVPVLATAEATQMSPPLHLWLAQQQLAAEQWAHAATAAVFATGAKLSPREMQIGWYTLGRAREALAQAAPAIDAYTRAVAFELNTREGTEGALRLGELQRSAGNPAAARQAFTLAGTSASALGELRSQARSYFGLGQVAESERDWTNAARYYMSVAVLFDDKDVTPQALFRAAQSFEHLGKSTERDASLAELRKRYPDSPFATRVPSGKAP